MPDAHLHDEQLTDAVDGTAPPDVSSHLATCAACRERLDTIRAAVQAVATPPPAPTAAARDAAVARALDVATPSRTRRSVAPWMAAAALIALLLGGVGVVLAQRDGGREQETAANRLDKAAGGDSAGVAGHGGVVDGGDLGDQADPLALNALLQQQLDGNAPARALAAEDASSAAESAPPAPVATAAPSCVAEAQDAGSDRVGALVLTARLRWQDEPAVVLVFAGTDQAPLARRAFVMAQRDCRLLVVQSF